MQINIHRPAVNIIVPVYNSAAYIERCLRSIVEQTLTNWQAICVDDGSTDDSGRLLDEWAKRDERFIVIHQPNGGVSKARNTALDKATAPYVTMLDVDDELVPNALERLYAAITKNDVDIVTSGYTKIIGSQKQEQPLTTEEKVLDIGSHLQFRYFTAGAWGKLYKRDLIEKNHIRYPLGIKMGEDYIFNICYWCHIKRAYITAESLYRYYDSETSVSRRFNLGLLPVETYLATLQITYFAYERIKNSPDFNEQKREWMKVLLRAHLIREYWVMNCTGHTKGYRAVLMATAKQYREKLTNEMPLSQVCAIKLACKIINYRSRLVRMAGKMKRAIFNILRLRKSQETNPA